MRIGDYEITKELAAHDRTTVYLARTPEAREVVIKALLLPGNDSDASFPEFRREIRITAALHHRNIVSFLASGTIPGLLYCVTEYCNGGSLRELLTRFGRVLTVAEAVPLIRQVLAGLDYAHNVVLPGVDCGGKPIRGIVHRDIKPENILLHYNAAGQYTAKIADFGLSKAFGGADHPSRTRTGDIGGSLAFLCRQQIINYKYVRPEVDVWSAIAVLYFLLTGVPPRSGRPLS
ncbi:MAG: serine/threonine-protein kinase, partial [Victivallales bacterium]|nr:serine/threonine-protein kinase [Victivallales bacterium]